MQMPNIANKIPFTRENVWECLTKYSRKEVWKGVLLFSHGCCEFNWIKC